MKSISRRYLLRAGLASAFVGMIPKVALGADYSDDEIATIGPDARDDGPYRAEALGLLDAWGVSELQAFASTAIAAWGFRDQDWDDRKDIASYASARLPILLDTKCNTTAMKATDYQPSYLAEYESAARLVAAAKVRFRSEAGAFCHLMFADRSDRRLSPTSRVVRARTYVFDEITRHILASGGFRTLGFVNYSGYFGYSLHDPRSFRRSSK